MKKNYELIEHTADIGIRVKGKDLRELFKNTAQAMFDIMAERKKAGVAKYKTLTIKKSADNLEELLVDWLNELLFLSATKELIFGDFKIEKLDENKLAAKVMASANKNYRIKTEIKAATYHELKIEKKYSGWQVQLILDV